MSIPAAGTFSRVETGGGLRGHISQVIGGVTGKRWGELQGWGWNPAGLALSSLELHQQGEQRERKAEINPT